MSDQRDEHDHCKKHKAHHLDNRYTSSDDESPNDNKKMVVSGGHSSPESNNEENLAVAIKPSAKKAKKTRHDMVVVERETVVP